MTVYAYGTPSFLKYSVIGELGCQGVGRHDKDERDQGFEQADRRGYTILGTLHADPVNKRIQNVPALIHLRAVQVEHLVKTGIQHIP